MLLNASKDLSRAEFHPPISPLSTISKLLENLLIPSRTINLRFDVTMILSNKRTDWSKLSKTPLKKKGYFSALFIDIFRAFDKVWNKGPMLKFKACLPTNIQSISSSCRLPVVFSHQFFIWYILGICLLIVISSNFYICRWSSMPKY